MNLNPDDILTRIRSYTIEIGKANAEFVRLKQDLAQAEVGYRRAKACKILQLKSEKTPVTIIADLTKGDDKVSELMLKRDTLDAKVEAQRFKIYSMRDCLSGEQAILKWLGIEYNSSGQ